MAIKQLGKKGMFLTFISISIIAAVIIIFTPSGLDLSKDMPVIKTRVSSVNEYVLDLENVYLERTLQATGRKTLIGLIKYMESQQVFFTDFADFEDSFSEVLLDGTIKGENIQIYYPDHNTYEFWLNKIKTTAQTTFNVDTVYGISDIRVYQTRPWFVNVDAELSFNVSSETASWNKTATITTEIQIEGFDDPYYIVKSLQDAGVKYENKIRQAGTKFDEWSAANVNDFITDGNYTHFQDSDAPSFLMRFYNDISASSCCGIESLVNPNNPAITDKDVSYVDYKYWKPEEICDSPSYTIFTVDGITGSFPLFPNFKLDFDHIAKYNLLADAVQICPPPWYYSKKINKVFISS